MYNVRLCQSCRKKRDKDLMKVLSQKNFSNNGKVGIFRGKKLLPTERFYWRAFFFIAWGNFPTIFASENLFSIPGNWIVSGTSKSGEIFISHCWGAELEWNGICDLLWKPWYRGFHRGRLEKKFLWDVRNENFMYNGRGVFVLRKSLLNEKVGVFNEFEEFM